ncbi:hypothetical protein IV498_14625 [Paenarthrobacter sp. Z7-10]|uniref:hypothetical protein n=1 Tax=Paenarthrobacter sp. Z7-10 TaxID=2787635 RepID=UPI0022A9B96E|nr:hypothetical protein [Paenarthrobacter sp. Z7-10]MCZ2404377.1 hypothetical protein [Paenarthrobacter sp. Z7-10]
MNTLPAAYERYLEGRDENFVLTVRPILLQSAADKLHGVRVVVLPHEVQAFLDEKVAYGEVFEEGF